jgi:hypothetical protein
MVVVRPGRVRLADYPLIVLGSVCRRSRGFVGVGVDLGVGRVRN